MGPNLLGLDALDLGHLDPEILLHLVGQQLDRIVRDLGPHVLIRRRTEERTERKARLQMVPSDLEMTRVMSRLPPGQG